MEVQSQFIEMFGSVDDNPKSYDIKKVGDFAECFAGATPSTKISSYWDNGNIPWMSSGEVHKARVQDTDAKITQQGYDGCSTKMVPIHSIVIALAGQGKTRGTVAINDIELCTNQSLCAIVPNEEVYYEYLFHNLRGRYKELRSMSGDVDGRGGLNLKHIQSIKVIVPPMSEQMKFVSIARQSDKSKFVGFKSQFIEMFKNLPVNGVIRDLTVGNIASVKKSYSKEDIINYIDISSIDNTTKTIVETSEHLVTKAPSRAQQCVQKGDILVSTVRPINRNIAVIEKDTSHLVASTGFCILRPQEGYKEYLLSIVLSDTYTEKMYDKANGGLYPAVNNSDVLNYGIHIPDEDTAKKVSALYQQSDKSKLLHRTSIKYSKYSL